MQDDVFSHATHLDLLHRAIFYYVERCSIRKVLEGTYLRQSEDLAQSGVN